MDISDWKDNESDYEKEEEEWCELTGSTRKNFRVVGPVSLVHSNPGPRGRGGTDVKVFS